MTSSLSQPYPSLAELPPPAPVEWLWPGWMPRGRLTILGGVTGVGKSFVALDLARRVTQGLPFPDGARAPGKMPDRTPGKVPGKMTGNLPSALETAPETALPMEQDPPGSTANSEGGFAQTVVYVDGIWPPYELARRARLNPFDTSRFFLLKPVSETMVDLNSPEDMDRLLDHIYYKKPALVVIDSLYTVFPRCGRVSRKNFRELAALLSSAAADTQTAILLVTEAFMYVRRKRFRYYDILLSDILPDNWLAGLECTVLGLHYFKTGQMLDPDGLHRLKILKSVDCQRVDPVCFEFIPLANDGVSLEWKPVPATLRGGRN